MTEIPDHLRARMGADTVESLQQELVEARHQIDRLTRENEMLNTDAYWFAAQRDEAQAEAAKLRQQLVEIEGQAVPVEEAAKGWLALGRLMADINAAMDRANKGLS